MCLEHIVQHKGDSRSGGCQYHHPAPKGKPVSPPEDTDSFAQDSKMPRPARSLQDKVAEWDYCVTVVEADGRTLKRRGRRVVMSVLVAPSNGQGVCL